MLVGDAKVAKLFHPPLWLERILSILRVRVVSARVAASKSVAGAEPPVLLTMCWAPTFAVHLAVAVLKRKLPGILFVYKDAAVPIPALYWLVSHGTEWKSDYAQFC